MNESDVMISLADHVAVALGDVQDRVYNPARGSRMDRIRRNIMIPSSLDKDLEAMAEALGETRSGLISKALARYLDSLDLEIARERARLHEKGKSKALTPAQMRKALGL
jgi:predicted transcriptional regulator